MKARIRVTFDMVFDSAGKGESNTKVHFSLTDHPELECPEEIKLLVVDEVLLLCNAMTNCPQLFDK